MTTQIRIWHGEVAAAHEPVRRSFADGQAGRHHPVRRRDCPRLKGPQHIVYGRNDKEKNRDANEIAAVSLRPDITSFLDIHREQ
jgi:hypothetical protein